MYINLWRVDLKEINFIISYVLLKMQWNLISDITLYALCMWLILHDISLYWWSVLEWRWILKMLTKSTSLQWLDYLSINLELKFERWHGGAIILKRNQNLHGRVAKWHRHHADSRVLLYDRKPSYNVRKVEINWTQIDYSPLQAPLYATGIDLPRMHAARLISHKFRYVVPSVPHTSLDGFETTDFNVFSYGGHFSEHDTQWGIKFWSSKQCIECGHLTFLQEAENS